jgi:hypothetical protein
VKLLELRAMGEEFRLLNIAWKQQQYELESARLSLTVRTAQRDKAEYELGALQLAYNKLQSHCAFIEQEIGK